MIRTHMFLALPLLALLVGTGPLPASAEEFPASDRPQPEKCRLSLRTPSEISWRGPHSRGYEALHSGAHGEQVRFEIRNAGGYCDYSLKIAPVNEVYALVGSDGELSFSIRPADGPGAAGRDSPVIIADSYRQPGHGKYQSFMLDLEPGQHVPAGRYGQDMELLLYQETDDVPVLADMRQIRIVADVWPKVSASIGTSPFAKRNQAQVDLGMLQSGKEQGLGFSVYANTPYDVTIESLNEGNLKHFRSAAKAPYRLMLDGKPVSLSAPETTTNVISGNTSASHDLRLTLDSLPALPALPAGYYEDRLTVTITAR